MGAVREERRGGFRTESQENSRFFLSGLKKKDRKSTLAADRAQFDTRGTVQGFFPACDRGNLMGGQRVQQEASRVL